MSYVQQKIQLSAAQQKRIIQGKSVRVLKSDIGKGNVVYLHPLNAKKLSSCKQGCNLSMSKGDIMYTAKHHNPMLGSGFLMIYGLVSRALALGLKTQEWAVF